MRIVGGRFRSRALRTPATQAIRPTTDRLRERLFDILTHWKGADVVRNARAIDLFAGTGALGLEALSRGARFVLFVDDGADACALIRDNVEALGVAGSTRLSRRDATRLGEAPAEPFTLAFVDPPYDKGLATSALQALAQGGWLAPGAVVVVEDHAAAALAVPPGYSQADLRQQGDTVLRFYIVDSSN